MIYADHAATTALSPLAFEAMRPYLEDRFANPGTLYSIAREPRKAVARARETIANAIGAQPNEIYFTSGGSEADSWALLGTALRYAGQKKRIITDRIEHHAVLHSCDFLTRLGFDVVKLSVDKQGVVSPVRLMAAIDSDTVLVSIMYANNEIGTIQPIERLSYIAHQYDVPFHTDAVQAVGHVPIDVRAQGIDLLSSSAHKFNGPKGIGFLYIREGIQLESIIRGGGQENGRRAGTENVAGIVGMAAALEEHVRDMAEEAKHMEMLRERLLNALRGARIDFLVNGAEKHIPGSMSLSFRLGSGEAMLHRLDLMGIAVATGSACNSKETELSHVISAIDVPPAYADGTIRITLGPENTIEEIDRIAEAIIKVIGV